ncbi:hypothetical protein [Catenulispora sp. GP43]|uniref:hypothetical protein n=1 Tax=Catenulispora sp. GP43 TaxID=3156263 RepID=UPI003512DC05
MIAHERAHVHGRHHLAIAFADAMEAAFPRIALFSVGRTQTARLVELAADDAACASTDKFTLAVRCCRWQGRALRRSHWLPAVTSPTGCGA